MEKKPGGSAVTAAAIIISQILENVGNRDAGETPAALPVSHRAEALVGSLIDDIVDTLGKDSRSPGPSQCCPRPSVAVESEHIAAEIISGILDALPSYQKDQTKHSGIPKKAKPLDLLGELVNSLFQSSEQANSCSQTADLDLPTKNSPTTTERAPHIGVIKLVRSSVLMETRPSTRRASSPEAIETAATVVDLTENVYEQTELLPTSGPQQDQLMRMNVSSPIDLVRAAVEEALLIEDAPSTSRPAVDLANPQLNPLSLCQPDDVPVSLIEYVVAPAASKQVPARSKKATAVENNLGKAGSRRSVRKRPAAKATPNESSRSTEGATTVVLPLTGLNQLMREDPALVKLVSRRLHLSTDAVLATDFQAMRDWEPLLCTAAAALVERMEVWWNLLTLLVAVESDAASALAGLSLFLSLNEEKRYQTLCHTNFSLDFLVPRSLRQKLLSMDESMMPASLDQPALVPAVDNPPVQFEIVQIIDDDDPPVAGRSAAAAVGSNHFLKVQEFAREKSLQSAVTSCTVSSADVSEKLNQQQSVVPSKACFQSFDKESKYIYQLLNGLGKYCIHRSMCLDAEDSSVLLCMLFIHAGYHKAMLHPRLYQEFEEMQLEFVPSQEVPKVVHFIGRTVTLAASLPADVGQLKSFIAAKQSFVLSKYRLIAFASILAEENVRFCDYFVSAAGQEEQYPAQLHRLGREWDYLEIINKLSKVLARYPANGTVSRVTKILEEAFARLEANMKSVQNTREPEIYRAHVVRLLEERLTAALQRGTLSSCQKEIIAAMANVQNSTALLSTSVSVPRSKGKLQAAADNAVSLPPAANCHTVLPPSVEKGTNKALPQPGRDDKLLDAVLQDVHISENIRISMANARRGYCGVCRATVSDMPEQYRAHVVADHRLVVQSLGAADMAELLESICTQCEVGRPGIYRCHHHNLTLEGRDTLLYHLVLKHEMIFHCMLVCVLYGTSQFVTCPFPECVPKIQLAMDRIHSHLLEAHLIRYVEMEMMQELKTAQLAAKSGPAVICPRKGCGFPQFLNLLSVHYALEHQVLQEVLRNFASVNNWNFDELRSQGLFSSERHHVDTRHKQLIYCPSCGGKVQTELVCLHLDQCAGQGQLAAHLQTVLLKVERVELYRQTYGCPFATTTTSTDCAAAFSFPQVFNHCLLKHNLYSVSPAQYKYYRRIVWPRLSETSKGPSERLPAGIAPLSSVVGRQPTEEGDASLAGESSQLDHSGPSNIHGALEFPRINLGYIKNLVRSNVKDRSRPPLSLSGDSTLCAASDKSVVEKSGCSKEAAAHKKESAKKPGKASVQSGHVQPPPELACPFFCSGQKCVKTFSVDAASMFFSHLFIHLLLMNIPDLALKSADKVKKCFAILDSSYTMCPLPYCGLTPFTEKSEFIQHFNNKHSPEIVAIYLIEQNSQQLLDVIRTNAKIASHIQQFLTTYARYFKGTKVLSQHSKTLAIVPTGNISDEVENVGDSGQHRDDDLGSNVAGGVETLGDVEGEEEEEEVQIVAAVSSAGGRPLASSAAPSPRSPGIVFVPARSHLQSLVGQFLSEAVTSHPNEIAELSGTRLLRYRLLLGFLTYTLENCEDENSARHELACLSEKVSHVVLGTDILKAVSSLLDLELISKFLSIYRLLREYSDHCRKLPQSSITTCDPLNLVIISSQFLTGPETKDKLKLFIAFVAELYGQDGSRDLLDHQTIREFLSLEQLVPEPLNASPGQHGKYLGCQSCFPNRQLYFLSTEDMMMHISGYHPTRSPGLAGCIRCSESGLFHVTSSQGSLANFLVLMEYHATSLGHLCRVFKQKPPSGTESGRSEMNCYLCHGDSTPIPAGHFNSDIHKLLRPVMDHYLNFCDTLSISPFKKEKSKTYVFFLKQLFSDWSIESPPPREVEKVLCRFLKTPDAEIFDHLFAPELLVASCFCYVCEAAFMRAADMKHHVEAACLQKEDFSRPYKCAPCGVFFCRSELAQHFNHLDLRRKEVPVPASRASVPWSCSACSHKSFRSEADSLLHIESHRQACQMEARLTCRLCGHQVVLANNNPAEISSIMAEHIKLHRTKPTADYFLADPKLGRAMVVVPHQERRMAEEAEILSSHAASSATFSNPGSGDVGGDFRCFLCEAEFLVPAQLQLHHQTVHVGRGLAEAVKSEPPEDSPTSSTRTYVPDLHSAIKRKAKSDTALSPKRSRPDRRASPAPDSVSLSKLEDGGRPDAPLRLKEVAVVIQALPSQTAGGQLPGYDNAQEDLSEEEEWETERNLEEEYFYFCLDCERERGWSCQENCDHTSHPRVPIGVDVAGHLEQTGHITLQPVGEHMHLIGAVVRLPNISYSSAWGQRVRRKWKLLVTAGDVQSSCYPSPRHCLRCGAAKQNALDMFIHIRDHLSQ